jgi:hypothetical protein
MVFIDILGECTAFISSAVSHASEKSKTVLAACLAYSSTLKVEAVHFLCNVCELDNTTWHSIPEDATLYSHGHTDLSSHIF